MSSEIKISIPVPSFGSQLGAESSQDQNPEGVNSVYTQGGEQGSPEASAPGASEVGAQEQEPQRLLLVDPQDPLDLEYKEPIIRHLRLRAGLKEEWNSLLREFQEGGDEGWL